MGAIGRPSERRPRPRAHDPDVRRRRGSDPPVGRRRDRLGLGSGRGGRGVAVKARPLLDATRPRCGSRSAVEPARGGGGRARLVPVDGPCSRPTTRRSRAAPRSRRCACMAGAVPARRAPGADARLGRAARHRRFPTGSRSWPPRRWPRPAARGRAAALPDAGARGSGAPFRSRSSAAPGDLEERRARGISLISLLGVRAEALWPLGGVKSTSYAVNMAAEAEARARGADDAVFAATTASCWRAVTNVWWRRGDSFHAVARPGHPRRRDEGASCSRLRRRWDRGRRGRVPARRPARCREVFTRRRSAR